MYVTAEGFNKTSKPVNKVEQKPKNDKENPDIIPDEFVTKSDINSTHARVIGP